MRRASALFACALASGCSLMESTPPPAGAQPAARATPARPVAPPRVTAGGELVAYLARIRDMGEKPLAAETLRQREVARTQGELEAVKLGLALSLAPASDDAEVIALLEPIARKPTADDDVRAMASFLLLQAAERRRLKEGAATAGSRLREERRATEVQKQRADALQERAAQLQQKIEALTELEKSLSDRPTPSR
jgi:hypothetical protein